MIYTTDLELEEVVYVSLIYSDQYVWIMGLKASWIALGMLWNLGTELTNHEKVHISVLKIVERLAHYQRKNKFQTFLLS